MKSSDIARPLLAVILILIVFALNYVFNGPGETTDTCINHRQFYFTRIDNGEVVQKFIDKENHAIKMVFIATKNRTYKIEMIPYPNWQHYDRIDIGDRIDKEDSSFNVTVAKKFSFALQYECDYSKR